ncbi:GAK system XXXCH domain-containing protein [Desulfovibrio psychrotolerans]|uniref:GAK system XXXCH domain-containing protein n=1 Tax=Desulfovibrio psychrotolerans TaxID=415242 RepID=A0A7J0BVV4_9BACT|nr:GAK system XXXCH domain-containing protein [Desulfovibrio psychrotolerans]GFM37846.1 hypothetical protein DSM19430T_25300 [Desulfovibrio psychrotolerans]
MSSKIDFHCTREELPGLFRALADALEARTAPPPASKPSELSEQSEKAEQAGNSGTSSPPVPAGNAAAAAYADAHSATHTEPMPPQSDPVPLQAMPVHCDCPAGTVQQQANGFSPDALTLLSGFRKMKLSVKDEFGQVSVKIKFRSDLGDLEAPDCACGGTLPGGMPSYKSLKKRMRSSFKSVYQAVHAGRLPSGDAVAAFVAESRLMVQYPGYGDPYYAAYDTAVNAFEAAWQTQDIPALHAAVDALNHLKTDCHQRYK